MQQHLFENNQSAPACTPNPARSLTGRSENGSSAGGCMELCVVCNDKASGRHYGKLYSYIFKNYYSKQKCLYSYTSKIGL